MIKRGIPKEEKKKQNRNIDLKITLFADYIIVYQKTYSKLFIRNIKPFSFQYNLKKLGSCQFVLTCKKLNKLRNQLFLDS